MLMVAGVGGVLGAPHWTSPHHPLKLAAGPEGLCSSQTPPTLEEVGLREAPKVTQREVL